MLLMNKSRKVIIVASTVRKRMAGESTGHDWWHVYRVWRNSLYIARGERGADLFIVQLAALLHDIADWKFSNGDTKRGAKVAREILKRAGVDEKSIRQVCHIVENVSYKGGFGIALDTREGRIVQDADRVDALGAIGIARAFAYGGSKGRELYNPYIKPRKYRNFEEFKKSSGRSTTINHFYEKLLLLRKRMNTRTGKELAMERERFMREYLERFYKEWKGTV